MKLLFVSILCCAVTAGWAQSQHPELPFDHLNIPGTINSSQVNDLIQDHHGLIWVAGNGLNRYDGYKFTLYRNITDSLSIAGQEINCLFSNALTNQLLLGTHSYGIVTREYASGTFTCVPSQGGTPIITHIAQTSDGTVWGSSFTNGVYFIEKDTLRKFNAAEEKFSSNSCIASMDNKLLVGGNRTVYILENKKLTDSIYIDFPGFSFSPVTRVTALLADRTGKLWIGTEQFGVFVYDMLTKVFTRHFSP
ncbi:MAG TPA: two-component regulator propeller domain-containing protein, partial [Cyclobacteriaceae bacterium]|nr:two-component regulator propeller domain-containing protein [Cyclobacteriaceae bacterium]